MTPDVYLCVSAFEAIRREAAVWRGKETGGILLGYETDRSIVVMDATGPGPNARRSSLSVELDTPAIQAATDRAAADGYQYQGSWHTHPTTGPISPSPTDRRLLRSAAWSSRYRLRLASVMLIARDSVDTLDDVLALVCGKRRIRIHRVRPTLTRDPRVDAVRSAAPFL